jgi:RNA polymerase-binding transcription factor DksA
VFAGEEMKQRVERNPSESVKGGILAMTQDIPMKGKRRAPGKSEGFRSRALHNLTIKRQEVEKVLKLSADKQREYEELGTADALIEDIDHAEREISAHRHYSILERKNKELKRIDLLIRKLLEDEEFGLCEECGRPIPEERLLIVPEAVYCVPCQRGLEKRWDMRGDLAVTFDSSSLRKNGPRLGQRQGFSDEESFTFDSDVEEISLMDLGEIDLEEPKGEKEI